MKAIVISRPGGPEVLEYRDVDDPVPGPRSIVVAVRATAVNRADILQRLGRYPAPPGVAADIPGLEFAGVVEQVGADVTSARPGDRVMGLLAGGGYAERVAVDAGHCMTVPDGLDWARAAAVPEAFLTAHDALVRAGRLTAARHPSVLIHAAGSGVGTAAVQIAGALGARVVALSRDRARRERLTGLGAGCVIDPTAADALEQIRAATDGGPSVVLDLVGADAWELNARALRPGGRWVLVGLLSGSRVSVDLGVLLTRRLELIGTVLRSRSTSEKRQVVERFVRDTGRFLRDGTIRPIVDRVLPLAEAADAHRAIERNEHFGKIVLAVGDREAQSRP